VIDLAGSFFDALPAGAGGYVLSAVLHVMYAQNTPTRTPQVV